MGGETKGAERKGPRLVVCVVCGLALAWLAFVPAYNAWRSPGNVFEEVYWGCVDEGCTRAVLCKGGVWYPGDYLPAFLNPFREEGTSGAGLEWSPEFASLWRRSSGDRVNDMDAGISSRFERYYGEWRASTDIQRELGSGVTAHVYDVDIATLGVSYLMRENRLVVSFYLEPRTESPLQDEDPIAHAVFTIPVGSGEVEARITSFNGAQDADRLVQVAKDILIDDLAGGYLALNESSTFSADDLGDWRWGEVTVEEVVW